MSVLSRCSRPVSRLSLPTSLCCLAPIPPRTPAVLVHLLRSTHNATDSNNPVTALESRGLVTSLSSPAVVEHAQSPTTIYCGVDPTAPSLHLGNFITLMGLLHFHVRGHQAIALIGGATGSIGDPSGRKTERVPLSVDTLEFNIRGIRTQLERFFARGTEYAASRGVSWAAVADLKVVNNADWMRDMSALEFLSDVGRFARVGTMLARESVKSRMDSAHGISFTEFSYQLLQAYDFWHLYHVHGCRIQLGGSDQWGNITAGIDMIHRKRPNSPLILEEEGNGDVRAEGNPAFGITIPLLTTSTGEKFGKSAGNAVWLDERLTSVYEFYQFFMKTTDADVGKYLLMFTLLPIPEIEEIVHEHMKNPDRHLAQHKLADEATELVHGPTGLRHARVATDVLFGGSLQDVSGRDLAAAFEHDSSRLVRLAKDQVVGQGLDAVAVLAGATKSKSEAQKLVKSGGLYLNNQRVLDMRQKIGEQDLLDGMVCVFRTGKSSYRLVEVL
ncbi:putative tyrosine-tRNA ligase [Jimgerdemannia flammicorona]|uniref:Tyrosine--tRNA ligase n=1 Tax=Jimgerdemannia flammicorona TaxID=994334 RepID=A0A433DES3_9FUNG|nr:putative tyrosine-tRNA ligase [Jimgerdemannia flammicorona]